MKIINETKLFGMVKIINTWPVIYRDDHSLHFVIMLLSQSTFSYPISANVSYKCARHTALKLSIIEGEVIGRGSVLPQFTHIGV